jgi:hypothetical protein
MPELCFNCDYEEELQPMRESVIITVRGESIPATKEFYQCLTVNTHLPVVLGMMP